MNKNQKKNQKKNPFAKNIRLSDRFVYLCAVGGIRVYDERINYAPPQPSESGAEKSGAIVAKYKYYTLTAGWCMVFASSSHPLFDPLRCIYLNSDFWILKSTQLETAILLYYLYLLFSNTSTASFDHIV